MKMCMKREPSELEFQVEFNSIQVYAQNRQMKRRTNFILLVSFGILACFVFALFLRVQYLNRSSFRLPSAKFSYNFSLEKPLDIDQTCQFPNLDPYDPSILPYLWASEPISCLGRNLPDLVFVDDKAKLRVNWSALTETGYDWISLSCDYQAVIRDDGNDEDVRYGEPVIIEADGQPLDEEFVFIRCKNFAGFNIYSGLHVNVVRKRSLPEREKNMSVRAVSGGTNTSKPNILILVLDSMSRSNFIRQLPITYKYLVSDMGAVVLRGMTKVGENTFSNIVPILTGLQAWYNPELAPLTGHREGWPYFRHPWRNDEWPFLWKNFSDIGYATLLAEDKPELSIFNYLEGGFQRPPTNHYMRPFWLAHESSTLQMFSSKLGISCKPKHLMQMDYVRRFTRTYRKVPHFGVSMLTELCHAHVNQLGAADGDFFRFFLDLHREGSLDNTFLVMMGDHGHQLDSIMETMAGSLERRMPFMAIYAPLWFHEAFPEASQNLKRNSRRLTSMRDLHFTLLDILEYACSGVGIGQNTRSIDGTTLFGPVSASRSCLQAGIPHQFCACDKEQRVNEDHPGVVVASKGLVESINFMTHPHRNFCTNVTLYAIRNVVLVTSNAESNLTGSSLEAWELGMDLRFRILVEVSPSRGLFEGMVVMRKDVQPRIMEGTTRINRYNNQAGCLPQRDRVRNPRLREFCYCPGYY